MTCLKSRSTFSSRVISAGKCVALPGYSPFFQKSSLAPLLDDTMAFTSGAMLVKMALPMPPETAVTRTIFPGCMIDNPLVDGVKSLLAVDHTSMSGQVQKKKFLESFHDLVTRY